MIYRKIKRLFNGLASLRDYEVEEAIKKNEAVQLSCEGQTMTLSVEMLKHGFSITTAPHKSKFNRSQEYRLVDFKWKPDKAEKDQIKLFEEGK
jgi:hypothetical protein